MKGVETVALFNPAAFETPESVQIDRRGNTYISMALTGGGPEDRAKRNAVAPGIPADSSRCPAMRKQPGHSDHPHAIPLVLP